MSTPRFGDVVARADRHVRALGERPQQVEAVVGERVLEPGDVELFEVAGHPLRVAERMPRAVHVDDEGELARIPLFANHREPGEELLRVAVARGLELEGAVALVGPGEQAVGKLAIGFVREFIALDEQHRRGLATAADEAPERGAEVLAADVPHRQVDE
jgi:hypothetical protein